jgi:phage shock protein C
VTSDGRNDTRSEDERDPRGEFQRSVDRLERAVQGFVSAANDQISNRAAGFIDETAQRLERELRDRGRSNSTANADESRDEKRRSRRHRRRHYRHRMRNGSLSSSSPGYRTSKLYLDKRHQRICGVCAGIARYFGVEVWVVRGIAITGLIFMASIVIPAYIIAAIVLPRAPDDEAAGTTAAAADHTSPAPELGTRLSPRGSLRTVQADLDQLELKLRRMESHVTSGQFELQRELKRIDV